MRIYSFMLATSLFVSQASYAAVPAVQVTDQWQVTVSRGDVSIGKARVKVKHSVTFTIAPADAVVVADEKYDSLPVFDEKSNGWTKGERLRSVITLETTAPGMFKPETLVIKSASGASPAFKSGKDYAFDGQSPTVRRLPGGAIKDGQPVWLDYKTGRNRIDSIVVNTKGDVLLLPGEPDLATPHPPLVGSGTVVIANVWVPRNLSALTADDIYPITEAHYPSLSQKGDPIAATLLPKTWAKLQSGQTVRILAWGDSVTEGGAASDTAHRYQNQFATMLQQRFPNADIELTTEGWGGHTSYQFLAEPPGALYNVDEKVMAPHYDLVIMEFVNDVGLTPAYVEQFYSDILHRLQKAGSEWIILTPHYTLPDWMGSKTVRIDTDPRGYVGSVKDFAARNHIAVADASLRWGHLIKEGIPYTTLLRNSVNHPDDRGHEMYALALMELFGGPSH